MTRETRYVHKLKTAPEHFRNIVPGIKSFEIRFNDRGYKVGHYLLLQEYDIKTDTYTGNEWLVKVTSILTHERHKGIAPGHVIMSVINSFENTVTVREKDKEKPRLGKLGNDWQAKHLFGGTGNINVCWYGNENYTKTDSSKVELVELKGPVLVTGYWVTYEVIPAPPFTCRSLENQIR